MNKWMLVFDEAAIQQLFKEECSVSGNKLTKSTSLQETADDLFEQVILMSLVKVKIK